MSFTGKVAHYLNISQEKWIISDAQKKEILQVIDTESSNASFMQILSVIGAICVWIGVILIVASNWSEFPKMVKLILSLIIPVISLAIWYFFTYVQTELKSLGNAFILLGWILIWATIALIGQIYNLDGTVWSLLRMWFILSLPLVFIFKLKTLAIMSTFLLYGVTYYYCTEVFFSSWRDEKYILATFTIISGALTLWAYSINTFLEKQYNYLLMPVCVISLKILFFILFIATLDDSFMFLWDNFVSVIIHNLLFLWTVIFVMWWANNNHEILLRHATFIWIGVYIFAKYILLFSGYLQAWVFFIVTGLFIIGLVYSFIKINRYLNRKETIS